jgi:ribosomal protein L11 methyltransferase
MKQRWAEIAVGARGDAQEAAGPLLTDVAGCQGYTATFDGVIGYLPVDDRLEGTLLRLREALHALPAAGIAGVPPDISVRFVEEADWANAWKQYFKPQRVGERLVVKPTWEAWDAGADEVVIQIDPGMAFGTGLHATTRLCLRALESRVVPGAEVADVGTGSGILAVAAALLGAARVTAVDIDPLAVRIARENAAVNRVEDVVTVTESASPPPGAFGIVVANILADVILSMAPALRDALRPDGLLIASGIIDTRADDVRRGLTAAGLLVTETRAEGEWAAILAGRTEQGPGMRGEG